MRQSVFKNFGGGQDSRNISELNQDEWQQEFGKFVEPIASWSDEGDTVWFVPHDVLHHVPLHALKVEGHYLIDRNPVCYTPSASVMKYCHAHRKDRRETAVVFGDSVNDLSHAREEARNVAKLFGTSPYLGNHATKLAVKTTFEKAGDDLDIVHFACHGYFNKSEPLESGIVLAAEQSDAQSNSASPTDVLTARELLQLEMRVTLLTLSACETGINERRPGDELIGLARSLIYAGAQSVMVSLWAVDDLSTRMLMEHFYECLRSLSNGGGKQVTKAEALRDAQRYVKGLTAQEVFEYYDKRLEAAKPAEAATLELDRADAQALAGDLEPAIAAYEDISHKVAGATSEEAHDLERRTTRKLTLLRRDKETTLSADYEIKPFDHLFYWAPFTLVGDWK